MKRTLSFLISIFLSHTLAQAAEVVQVSYESSSQVYALTDKGQILPVINLGTYPPNGVPPFVKVETGNGYALGLTAAGAVVSWNNLSIPPEVLTGVIDIASSDDTNNSDQNWALKSNGTLVHWANNQTTEIFNRPNLKSITFCYNTGAVGLQHDGTVIRLRAGTLLNISNVRKIGCGGYKRWFLLNNGQVATLNNLNQVIYANSQANGDAIDIGTSSGHLFVLKSDGSVVRADASSGGMVEQPAARLTKNIKALAGEYALRKDGSVISLYENQTTTIRSHFRRERHDLIGNRIDRALWKLNNSDRLRSTQFRGRGLGTDLIGIGWVGESDWQVVGKGRFFSRTHGKVGYIAKNPKDGFYRASFKVTDHLALSQYNAVWNMGVFGSHLKLELTGDINGDGIDEIVWRNLQTGNATIGFYHTDTPFYRNIGTYASNVRFEAISDFDNNGFGDILFRNTTTGNTMIRLFDSTVMTTTPSTVWKTISVITANLNIVAVDDFNMDGIDDIMVQNPASGRVMVGRMTRNLNAPINWTDVISVSPPIQLVNVGDYDGDGFKDILWRNPSSGNISVTYIENYLPVGTYYEGNVPTTMAPIK